MFPVQVSFLAILCLFLPLDVGGETCCKKEEVTGAGDMDGIYELIEDDNAKPKEVAETCKGKCLYTKKEEADKKKVFCFYVSGRNEASCKPEACKKMKYTDVSGKLTDDASSGNANKESCQTLCQNKPACKFFSYGSAACIMYGSAPDPLSSSVDSSFISGPPDCQLP